MGRMSIDELQKYINALRKCAKEHEFDWTSTEYIIVSDLCQDTANLLEELAQEPSGNDAVSRDVVKEQMLKYGFHAPDMTVTEFVEDCLQPVNPKESTTKNDLGVVCIDKTELLKAMDTWDKFGDDPNEGLIPLRTPALQDRYVAYVKYDDMIKCVKNLPSYYYDDSYCRHSSIGHLEPDKRVINMTKRIDLPTVGEILKEEFMDPYDISVYRLAEDIFIPVYRIQAILNGTRKITVDTSIRLGKYFGVSYNYFLNIQNDIDIRHASEDMFDEINKIKQIRESEK